MGIVMKINSKILFFVFVLCFAGCGLPRQIHEVQNFVTCEFMLKDVQNIKLANVDVQHKNSFSDLNIFDAGMLSASLAQGTLPLDMTLNIDVKNPNPSQAAMNKMEWILLIDDTEIVNGALNKRVVIAPNGGTTTLPLQISIDLIQTLQLRTDQILSFGFGLANAYNKPRRITLKVKPSIMIGDVSVAPPGYISLSSAFTAR
jgi:hypothetical protein